MIVFFRLVALFILVFIFAFFRFLAFDRMFSIIGKGLMTARGTAPPSLGFDEFQGEFPFPERDLVC